MSNCRLIHGDCITEMRKLIDEGVKVDLILTDPPYNTTNCNWDLPIDFTNIFNLLDNICLETTPYVLFGDAPFSSKLRLSNPNYKYDWIWEKEAPSNIFNGNIRPMKYTENIMVFYRKQCLFNKQLVPRLSPRIKDAKKNNYQFRSKAKSEVVGKGCRSGEYKSDMNTLNGDFKNPYNIIYFPRVKGNSKEKVNHSAQKPVALLEYLIKTYTNEGDLVLDFTMGSGSTGVACNNLNRDFIGIELDKNYYDIAVERCKNTQTKLKVNHG